MVGYIDNDLNYLLLYKRASDEPEDGLEYTYSVYDKSTGKITESLRSQKSPWDISCCNGQFTYIDENLTEDQSVTSEIFAVTYNEKFEEISRLSSLTVSDSIHYISAVYSKQLDKYFVCYRKDGRDEYIISRFSKDGKEEKELFSDSDYYYSSTMLLADNRIILCKYRAVPDGCSIQVIDFDGNEITADMPQSTDYYALMGQKSGKYYCLLSNRTGYASKTEEFPEDTLYLYDGEKDKIVEFTPEEAIEMGCVRITPDGTKAVTITEHEFLNEEQTNRLYTDLVIKIYDLDTGEKINEIKNDKGSGVKGRNIQAFDDRIVVYDGSITDCILYQFRYDEQAG